jgi:hypothetical protein
VSISDAQYAEWLRSSGHRRCILAEAKVYAGGAEITRYISNLGYVTAPGDTPANTYYKEILLGAPRVSSGIDQAMSIGEIVLYNADGSLDGWLSDGWDGRDIVLLIGNPAWPRADFRPWLTGVIDHISAPSLDTLALSLRDKKERLNAPVQTDLYATGSATGQPKPLAYGYLKNCEPILKSVPGDSVDISQIVVTGGTVVTVTTSTAHGFLASDRIEIGGVSDLYLNGTFTVATVPDSTHFTVALPVTYGDSTFTNPPDAMWCRITDPQYQLHDGPISAIGAYRFSGVATTAASVDLANGTFVPADDVVGTLTVDLHGAKNGLGNLIHLAGDIIQDIATRENYITSGDIDAASIAALNAAATESLGLYIRERRNCGDVLDQIMATVGGYWGFTRAGLLYVWRLSAPSGTPVLVLTSDDLTGKSLRIVSREAPVAKVRVGRWKNWTVQSGDSLAPALSDDDRAKYASANLADPDQAENAGIETTYKGALMPEIFDSLYANTTAEAARLAALRNVWRSTWECQTNLSALQLHLGDVVRLTYPRLGFESGALAIVVGLDDDIDNEQITVRLWR